MEYEFLINLAKQYPVVGSVLMGLGALVVVGQCVVVITPTKKDDEAWEKIKAFPIVGHLISALANFAPIQKKEPPSLL